MKTKTRFNKLTAWVLSLAMLMTFMPCFTIGVSAETTSAEATIKNIMLGTDHITGGQQSNIYFGRYQQSSLGNTEPTEGIEGVDWIKSETATQNGQGAYYSKDPIKWRVLDTAFDYDNKATDGTTDTTTSVLLLSDTNLDVVQYHTDYEAVTWETSTIRSWLNGYGATSNQNDIDYSSNNSDSFINSAFGDAEKGVIADTKVVNDDNPTHGTDGGEDTTDKVFLLSIAEAQNTSYFADRNSRKAVNTAYVYGGGKNGTSYMDEIGYADCWWLRSPGNYTKNAAYVFGTGNVTYNGNNVTYNYYAVRPACNLNLSSVLFTSAAKGGKSSTAAVGVGAEMLKNADLSTLTDNDGYKLTLLDSNRSFSVSDKAEKTVHGGETLSIEYSGAVTGANEYISAMLTTENEEVIYYGQLAQPEAESGIVELTIPSNIDVGTYTLKLFNEQINGDYKTDYSSDFINITLNVHEYNNGICCGEYEPVKANAGGIYEISNAGQLMSFAEIVNGGNVDASAVLTNDIDMDSIVWTPIGTVEYPYKGTFDGRGHSISNFKLNITSYGDWGLFGNVEGADIKNFHISGEAESKLTADRDVDGSLFDYGVIAEVNNGTKITNVHSSVNFTSNDDYIKDFVGGIVGKIQNSSEDKNPSSVEGCSFSGNVNLANADVDCCGGIVGYVYAGDIVSITNCGFYGNISTEHNEADQIGGILAYYRCNGLTLKNCLNAGTIESTDTSLNGAIIGVLRQHDTANSNVTNNYYLNGNPFGNSSNDDDLTDGYGGQTIGGSATAVTSDELASGEVAYLLGEAWGQTIGTDNYPVLGGEKVYFYENYYRYINIPDFEIDTYTQADYEADNYMTNVILKVPETGTYTLIIADYEGNRLNDVSMSTTEFEEGVFEIHLETQFKLGDGDKIMLWNSLTELVPLCEAYIVGVTE